MFSKEKFIPPNRWRANKCLAAKICKVTLKTHTLRQVTNQERSAELWHYAGHCHVHIENKLKAHHFLLAESWRVSHEMHTAEIPECLRYHKAEFLSSNSALSPCVSVVMWTTVPLTSDHPIPRPGPSQEHTSGWAKLRPVADPEAPGLAYSFNPSRAWVQLHVAGALSRVSQGAGHTLQQEWAPRAHIHTDLLQWRTVLTRKNPLRNSIFRCSSAGRMNQVTQ